MREHLGLSVPEPPEFDMVAQHILTTFNLASRGRSYVDGQPLPISVRDITDVVSVHPVPINRDALDYVIFEIDEIALKEHSEASKKNQKASIDAD